MGFGFNFGFGAQLTPPPPDITTLMSDDFEDTLSGNLDGQAANNGLGGSGSWVWGRVEGNNADMQADGAGNVTISGGSWIRVGFTSLVTGQAQGARATVRVPAGGMATLEIRGVVAGAQLKIQFPQGSKPKVHLWSPGNSGITLTDFTGTVPTDTDVAIYAYAEDLPTTGIRITVGLGAEEVTKDISTSDLAAIDTHRLGSNTYAGLSTDLGSQGATVRSFEWAQW